MKKKILIIFGIIIFLLIAVGLVTSYIDMARVRNSVEPKFTIKIVSSDGNKVTYWGLGYKVIRYPSVSPNEPYKNNRGVKYGNWFMKYDLSKYDEIKESVKKAVEWNIKATHPTCSISNEYKNEKSKSHYNSSHLINQGYIKKDELLDVDNKSYCDVYVKIYPDYEDPNDYQSNCSVYYKIYLKCKNYEEKGYINWGD